MTAGGPEGPDAATIGRLTRRAEFQAAAKGRRYHTERMTVQGRTRDPATEAGGLRLGLTVTKKVGHATERNRIRRRFRAAAARALAESRDVPVDVVLVGRREALAASFDSLVDDIRQAVPVVGRPGKPRTPRRSAPPTQAAPLPGDSPRGTDHG